MSRNRRRDVSERSGDSEFSPYAPGAVPANAAPFREAMATPARTPRCSSEAAGVVVGYVRT